MNTSRYRASALGGSFAVLAIATGSDTLEQAAPGGAAVPVIDGIAL